MKALITTRKGNEVLNKSLQKKQALTLSFPHTYTHTSTWRQAPEIREKASALPSVNFTPSATGKACLHTQRFRLWTWSQHGDSMLGVVKNAKPCVNVIPVQAAEGQGAKEGL